MLEDARILVTGGCGFIGSNFILHLLERYSGCRIVNLDKLTYASNPANLRDVEADPRYRFVQVSTDEVYGEVPPGVYARESDPLHPRSPYAASKAGGDAQCIAFFETYGVPVISTRAVNNNGPRQHVEKAVPLF